LDVAPYRRAVRASRGRLAQWNPVDPDDLVRHLQRQSRDRRTFLIHALTPEGDHDIVGKINVTDVVRGRFESAAMGYDAYDPYAGRGLFSEGLRLVLDLAFAPESDGGMGLHRVEATVQPGNVRSAGLLRSLGFAREGFSPRLLWLPGPDGVEAWRDHDSYVMRREGWPSLRYPTAPGRSMVVVVNGAPGPAKTQLARALAAELRIPLFSRDVFFTDVVSTDDLKGSGTELGGSGTDALWAVLADSPVGGVVEGWFRPQEARSVVEGLQGCGLDPAKVLEVWCSSAQVREPAGRLAQGQGQGQGLGPMVVVDTGSGVEPGEIVRIALQVLSFAHVRPLPGPISRPESGLN